MSCIVRKPLGAGGGGSTHLMHGCHRMTDGRGQFTNRRNLPHSRHGRQTAAPQNPQKRGYAEKRRQPKQAQKTSDRKARRNTPEHGCLSQAAVVPPPQLVATTMTVLLFLLCWALPEAGTEADWSPKAAFFRPARPLRTPRRPASRPTNTPAKLHPATHKKCQKKSESP